MTAVKLQNAGARTSEELAEAELEENTMSAADFKGEFTKGPSSVFQKILGTKNQDIDNASRFLPNNETNCNTIMLAGENEEKAKGIEGWTARTDHMELMEHSGVNKSIMVNQDEGSNDKESFSGTKEIGSVFNS